MKIGNRIPALTADATPTLTFTTTEAGEITYGGGCKSTATSASVGNNAITFNVLVDGFYESCTIVVTDKAGNASSPMLIPAFSIDATVPVLLLTFSVITPSADTTPSFTFSSTEVGSITYGGACSSASATAVIGDNMITLNLLDDGSYSNCTVRVTDKAGNISSILTVPSFVIDTTAPSLTMIRYVPSPTNDTTPSITFNSTEAGVIVYGGSCSSGVITAVAGNNGVTFNALAFGTYGNCTIRVKDASENISATLVLNQFVIAVDSITSWYKDNDGDSYGAGVVVVGDQPDDTYVGNGKDCNDGDININPSKEDIKDGVDNNCDTTIDNNVAYVFVTSNRYTGNLGGISGANKKCKSEKNGLPGDYRAWLSDSTTNARQNIFEGSFYSNSPSPRFILPNGVVVAENTSQFLSENHLSPMNVGSQLEVLERVVWTNTDYSGF